MRKHVWNGDDRKDQLVSPQCCHVRVLFGCSEPSDVVFWLAHQVDADVTQPQEEAKTQIVISNKSFYALSKMLLYRNKLLVQFGRAVGRRRPEPGLEISQTTHRLPFYEQQWNL